MSSKVASAKLEGEVKQEKGNSSDLRKMLAEERNVMSTMDMEHQQQMVELEQQHQEKVLYLLNQLQSKPLGGEPDKPQQRDEERRRRGEESPKQKELLQRLKVQVRPPEPD